MQATEIRLDDEARGWVADHPSATWAIDYDVHRCCGGGKICEVNVRELRGDEGREGYVEAFSTEGSRFLIAPRAARRLPATLVLTIRGFRRKHLDLILTGDQWGDLLYT